MTDAYFALHLEAGRSLDVIEGLSSALDDIITETGAIDDGHPDKRKMVALISCIHDMARRQVALRERTWGVVIGLMPKAAAPAHRADGADAAPTGRA